MLKDLLDNLSPLQREALGICRQQTGVDGEKLLIEALYACVLEGIGFGTVGRICAENGFSRAEMGQLSELSSVTLALGKAWKEVPPQARGTAQGKRIVELESAA